ncbi:MAG TPA: sigma-70 family RNA polymerase sigma factor [Ktedonobacterales bacterium]|nr:sigma-70 family RNA polymerase sigma factor [Ktedonobacterales bacterium]
MQQPERMMLDDAPGAGVGATLYQRYAPAIFAYLLKQTASREDAEDLLLEVFLAAMERGSLTDLREPEQRAWLWGVARHKAVDHFRRQARHPSVHLRLVAETLYEDEQMEPEQIILKQEALAALIKAIESLPARQQEVLRLRFGHGLACGEIATLLKKRESAVRMLLSRTLKALRALYSKP